MVEVFPGAISIKFATYTGYKSAGIIGAIMANLGNLLTPALLILLTTYFYALYEKHEYVNKAFNGVKYAVIGMIAAIMYQYAIKNGGNWQEYVLILIGAALIIFFKLHPAYVVMIAALIGILIN